MTRAHKLLESYFKGQFPEAVLTAIDEDKIEMVDGSGAKQVFTLNIYGDIMDVSNGMFVAYSNIPHSIEWLLMNINEFPTEWKNNPEYFK